jgi:hypothetical protein
MVENPLIPVKKLPLALSSIPVPTKRAPAMAI